MKLKKQLLGIIMSLVMVLTVMPVMTHQESVIGAETFEVTKPTDNKLVGAGYIDIEWSTPSGTISGYDVYIDGEKIASTSLTSYEYYTTQVKMYSVKITAKFSNGSFSSTPLSYFSVTKKGLCVNDDMGKNLDPKAMNMGWYYTWGTTPFSYTTYKQAEFVPMIWGTGSEGALSNVASKNYKYLLGYNEPDMGGDVGGSNIDVNVALSHWNNFVNKSQYLGSPAPALSPSWDSGTWFRTFMNRVDQNTIDFIPLHCYYGQYGGAAGANSFLTDVVDKSYEMYHKPIWVTEFAVSGWGYSNAAARASLKEFMTTVIDGLNQRSYVERYSWFSFNTTDENNGASALWTNSTGVLTELGQVYANYGNPEGYTPSADAIEDYKVTVGKQNSILSDTVSINGITCEDYINKSGVSATASSQVNNTSGADKAIDSSITSRWESVHGEDPGYITIDLGAVRNIKQVSIIWEAASAKDYKIQVSTDGNTFETVAELSDLSSTDKRLDTIVFRETKSCKFVRIYGTARTTNYGYSIFDTAIYGTTNAAANETTAQQTTTKPPVIVPTTQPQSTQAPTTKEPTTQTPTTKKPTTNEPTTSNQPTTGNNETTVGNTETTTVTGNAETSVTDVTTEVETTTYINPTKIKKVKKSAKKITVSVKKIKNIKGYNIQKSTTKKFSKTKTSNKLSKSTTIKLVGMKKGKKYYLRVRTFIIVDGKKKYSAWSKTKIVKM